MFQTLKDVPIRYGVWNYIDNKPIADPAANWEFTHSHGCVSRPDQLLKRKIGTCWDTSLYIYDYFHKYGIEGNVVYFNKKNHESHTFCMIPSPRHWYIVEYSYEQFRGIHEIGNTHDSLKSLIKHALGEYNVSANDISLINPKVKVVKFINKNGPIITFDDFIGEANDVDDIWRIQI